MIPCKSLAVSINAKLKHQAPCYQYILILKCLQLIVIYCDFLQKYLINSKFRTLCSVHKYFKKKTAVKDHKTWFDQKIYHYFKEQNPSYVVQEQRRAYFWCRGEYSSGVEESIVQEQRRVQFRSRGEYSPGVQESIVQEQRRLQFRSRGE